MTSHIVGAVLGIVATVLCVVFAAINGNGIWSCKWSNIWIYYDFIVYHVKYLPWTKS